MGYRREESDRLRSLKQVRELHDRARAIAVACGGDNGMAAAPERMDAELAADIAKFGAVAGYPKLEPGFWDDDDFCLLPGLLIFEGKSAADPAWLNLVHDRDRLLVATTESGFIDTNHKYQWYQRCKTLKYCPFGKRPTIPQCDGHASNESVEMSAEMELEDQAYLVEPPGHSTHLTQQLDQTGGPIQHFKRILRALLRNLYRLRGKFSRAAIARAVELAYVLSFTPAVCSWATRHVGWDEDAQGRLVYAPLSRPHILALVEDDEATPAPTAAPAPAVATTATTTTALAVLGPSREDRLAAFRSGAMDGRIGVQAAKTAALEVLGRSAGDKDGWSDAEEETINEEGSRARRNANPRGRIVGSMEFRVERGTQARSTEAKAAAERVKVFKLRRQHLEILEVNSKAEAKLCGGAAVAASGCSVAELVAFVRARTGEVVHEKGETLQAKAQELRSKPNVIALRVGLEPEGYQDWLAEDAQEKARKKAAKASGGVAPEAADAATPSAPVLIEVQSPRAKLARLAEGASPSTRAALEAARAAMSK